MSVTSILPFEFGAPRNLSSKRGAELLATMIVEYWRERGYIVQMHIVSAGFHSTLQHVRHDIRSDMVNGLPAKRLAR